MKVELLDHMGTDLTVVNSARVSFDKVSLSLDERDVGLISYLARHNHWTPFAHCMLQFRVETSIFVARQLVKHQVGLTWNEVSRRYVDDTPTFEPIDGIRARADKVKQGSSSVFIDRNEEAIGMIEAHQRQSVILYQNLLNMGAAPEQARIVLPLNMQTMWIWTGSLYAFARVAKLRLDAHAQYETRKVAEPISTLCGQCFPNSWKELMKV